MRNTVIDVITKETEKNNDIIFMTADLGFNVVNKFYDRFKNNYINVGISEQNMTLMSAGIALSGKKVVTYSIGNFSTIRVLEHIRNAICYHNADVKIIALAAGFAYGPLGFTHHATEDIAAMRSMSNMTIFSPSDPVEARICMKHALDLNGPCYIRLGRGGEKKIHSENLKFKFGETIKINEGKDVVIFATGTIINEAIKAIDELQGENINVGLYSFPTIKPIDKKFIIECTKKYKIIITLEENNIENGFGSAIANIVSSFQNDTSIKMIGLNNEIPSIVGTQDYLRKIYKIDKEEIKKNIYKSLDKIKK